MNSDIINKSPHYNTGNIECIKALKEWMTEEQYRGFLKGNVIKYLCREGHKDSREQDCKKAQYYLNKLVESFDDEASEVAEYDDMCKDCIRYEEWYDDWCMANCSRGAVGANNLPLMFKKKS